MVQFRDVTRATLNHQGPDGSRRLSVSALNHFIAIARFASAISDLPGVSARPQTFNNSRKYL
jgi:hypothetical protein